MPTPPVPKTPPAKGSFGKWIAGHKWEAGLGGAGIGITIFLAVRARKNAASGTSSTSSPAATNALPSSYYYPGGSGSSFDPQQLNDAFAALAAELSSAGQPSASKDQSTFIPLTASEAWSLSQQDPGSQSVYYQSAPGIFTQTSVQAFTPTSNLGDAYLLAPTGYSAPQGVSPVTGVIGGK